MPRRKRSGLSAEEMELQTTDHLLSAASDAFRDLGFAATSTTEIARRARASKHSLYVRYPSKEKLFLAVLQRELAQTTESAKVRLDSSKPVQQVLREMCLGHLTRLLTERHISLLRIVYMEAHRFPELADAFIQSGPGKGRELLGAYLATQTKVGTLRIGDVRAAAEQLLALVVGDLVHNSLLGMQSPSHRGLVKRTDAAVAVFMSSYGVGREGAAAP